MNSCDLTGREENVERRSWEMEGKMRESSAVSHEKERRSKETRQWETSSDYQNGTS